MPYISPHPSPNPSFYLSPNPSPDPNPNPNPSPSPSPDRHQENVDNDDGSAYYHTHDNFLVYGGNGMKNDFGGHDNHHYRNVYAYAGMGLGVCSQQPGHEDYFYGNKLVTTGTKVGDLACDGDAKTVVHDNAYYTASGSISECKMDLKAWQARGNDKGSTVGPLPTDETIIGWARSMLGF